MQHSIHLEVIYQGSQCPASYYMDEAVAEVVEAYGEQILYTKVEYQKSDQHALRLRELSVALYGEEAVRNGFQYAPIPSLFINGELIFDVIPTRDELIAAIEEFLCYSG